MALMDLLREMPSSELLDLYTLFVKVDHYDPVDTDPEYLEWQRKGVTTHGLHNELVRRLMRLY